jgi:hypothetical protein
MNTVHFPEEKNKVIKIRKALHFQFFVREVLRSRTGGESERLRFKKLVFISSPLPPPLKLLSGAMLAVNPCSRMLKQYFSA